MIEQKINVMVNDLPFQLKKEVLDFVEFLSEKYRRRPAKANVAKKHFKFDWEGGLADVGKKMNSVDLQHKAMDWR